MSEERGNGAGSAAPGSVTAGGGKGSRAGLAALVGVVAGLVVGFALAWVAGGNPLADSNQVEFVTVTVASVDDDRLCWAEEPERRDSPLQCAVLALDPETEPPEEGDRITAGLLALSAPDGTEVRQVVHIGPADGPGATPGD